MKKSAQNLIRPVFRQIIKLRASRALPEKSTPVSERSLKLLLLEVDYVLQRLLSTAVIKPGSNKAHASSALVKREISKLPDSRSESICPRRSSFFLKRGPGTFLLGLQSACFYNISYKNVLIQLQVPAGSDQSLKESEIQKSKLKALKSLKSDEVGLKIFA